MISCACGCGRMLERCDSRGRPRSYIAGHQSRRRTPARSRAARRNIKRAQKDGHWNQGHINGPAEPYSTTVAWALALRKVYQDRCMRCGWHEGRCDAHHIIPRSEGGANTIDNGIILCPNCHRLATSGVLTIDDARLIKSRASSS